METLKIKDVVKVLEKLAPLAYQEDYDNAGLLTGHPEDELKGILLCLDSTEDVLDEAIEKGCNMVIAHHPIIFRGLKRINGNNYVERVIIKAIRNNIAIYAAHTNLDNVLAQGVNWKFAQKIGLQDLKILDPKRGQLVKVVVYSPAGDAERVRQAMFDAGGGKIGLYDECSYSVTGQGSFRGLEGANPAVGEKGKRETVDELRIEILVPSYLSSQVVKAARTVHPYEEMAYDVVVLDNLHQGIGSGVVGTLEKALPTADFLELLKREFKTGVIRHTTFGGNISKVALCGGAGSFLTKRALAEKVDAFVTSDLKYHEFFDADNQMLLCDIGHYESEISTLEIFYEVIRESFPNFAVAFCKSSTNPVQYYK